MIISFENIRVTINLSGKTGTKQTHYLVIYFLYSELIISIIIINLIKNYKLVYANTYTYCQK
jgi:hypothetical protein